MTPEDAVMRLEMGLARFASLGGNAKPALEALDVIRAGLAHIEAVEAERDRLRALIEGCCQEVWRGCDIDGGWFQDRAAELGFLAEYVALAERPGLPYPDDRGRTHWEGCWLEPGHHNCAVREIDRLRADLAERPAPGAQDAGEVELALERLAAGLARFAALGGRVENAVRDMEILREAFRARFEGAGPLPAPPVTEEATDK